MIANFVEDGVYTGYYWLSDETCARVIEGSFDQVLDAKQNPFIVEAQLFDDNRGVSYNIRYVDGRYLINRYEVRNTADNEEIMVVSHAIKGVDKLRFLQYWKAVPDDLCEGMSVLKPAELVFIGFEKKKEDKDDNKSTL